MPKIESSRMRVFHRRSSLGRRLFLAVAGMMLPLIAVGGLGVLTFRATAGALEDFRAETVGQSTRIAKVRDLLVNADDAGELYVEAADPLMGDRFRRISAQIDEGFEGLETLDSHDERALVEAARARWETARSSIAAVISDGGVGLGDELDPFHDHVDGAASFLSDAVAMNVSEVAEEIASLRARERFELLASLLTLILGSIVGALLARRAYRSVTKPLALLEEAAIRLGSDDLSHRIDVTGDDELAHVSSAFNSMADRLAVSREALHHQARHDPLTGLPNRTLFIEGMERSIARAHRKGSPVSVLYLDLDEFKAVNDTHGHQAGDEILTAVAQRLRTTLRMEDIAARLGGDEFGAVIEEDAAGASRAAERLAGSIRETYAVGGIEVTIGVSIGVATWDGVEELDELLRRADTAMYAAKASGRGGWRAYGPELDDPTLDIPSLSKELERAIEKSEFVLRLQPVVDLQTGTIEGVEALVRWAHPEQGLLPPSAFLAEAERSDQILSIDRWVLRESCRQLHSWQAELPDMADFLVHVNVSARWLQHPGLADEIAEILRSTQVSPRNLTLEITETTLVRDPEAAARELIRLKDLGVGLALDDFGTGFSSLSHLVRFPIDTIKVDRSFVSTLGADARRSQILLAFVNLGRTLGLRVVAEGIERPEQGEYLRSIGCQQGQGYYFAKPLPADEIVWLLRDRAPIRPVGPTIARVLSLTGSASPELRLDRSSSPS